MTSTLHSSLDSCPRCGYALDQPDAPVPPLPPPPPVTTYAESYPAPAPAPAASSGMTMPSVPKILLGLGATCLLVASAIFLAVAWSWLGVGGRTAVLVGLTTATALAGRWLVRRDLGVAAEALTVVSLGLVVMDVLGARGAGWIDASGNTLGAVIGCALLAVSLGMCLPARRLFAPQVAAPLGLGLLVLGVAGDHRDQVVAAVSLSCFLALALLGRRIGAVVLPWTAGAGAFLSGATFAILAAEDASAYPTLRGLWVEGHGFGLVLVAGVVLLPWALMPGHDDARQWACATSVSVLTVAAALPVFDESPTAVTLAAAVSAVVWAVASAATPPRWYAVPRVPLAGSLLVLVPIPVALAGQGIGSVFDVAPFFSADWLVRLDPAPHLANPLLVPLAVVVVGLAATLTLPRRARSTYSLVGIGYLTAFVTAAQFSLPLVVFVAALGPFGVVVAFPSAVLTLVALGEVVLVAAYELTRRTGDATALSALVLPVALGGFLWVGGHVLAVPHDVRSVVVLVALGLLALAVPQSELQLPAAVTALVASGAGVLTAADPSFSLAVHLTVAGGLVTVISTVHRDHRPLVWLGGGLLAAATWVRLFELGVRAPEAYTLPTAVVLLIVGLAWMNRDAEVSTTAALLPGLTLATLPTLLWALADPLSTRAVVIGAVCLVLLVGGASYRWTAPVLVGSLCGAVLVVCELAPYAVQTPQWMVIGAAGAVLIAAGVTWEARVRDLRRAAAYMARLR
jgi:hypothetical protein